MRFIVYCPPPLPPLTPPSSPQVRDSVLAEVEAILLSGGSLAETIVSAGKNQLQQLVEQQPPQHLFAGYLGRPSELKQWDEATVKACLHLPLTILPLQQALIHEYVPPSPSYPSTRS